MRVLEFFSGIGGMHYALKGSGIKGQVVAAVEINTVANDVYKYNFPQTKLFQKNIQSFRGEDLKKFSPEMILMSPPCQPFTRVGLKKDIQDDRTEPLLHIINLLPQLGDQFKYILVENVKGFETSEARKKLTTCLEEIGFVYQEFILSPKCIGTPNVRNRYYLLAKKRPLTFCFPVTQNIMEELPKVNESQINMTESTIHSISDILDIADDAVTLHYQELLIPDKILLKRAKVMDIVTKDSEKSSCFTKSYGQYVKGTGSVYCPLDRNTVESVLHSVENVEEKLRGLKLRYFSPKEICRLMNFPNEFEFPDNITRKQRYRLLGNSINVKVVALLIYLMCFNDNG